VSGSPEASPGRVEERRRRLLVATRSRHKLNELRQLLHLPHTRLVTLDEAGVEEEAVEDGPTFHANAVIKARFYAGLSGLPTLADDSGLEVEALDGDPGVRTRRYAGENATDEENNVKLLDALAGLPPGLRGARYVCALVYAEDAAGPIVAREGTFVGRIADGPRGTGGFGYDPIFEPAFEPPGGRTVGQLTAAEKNAVSHRAVAARAMGEVLRELGY
jgi:XTP/dITP diphosphohydrolase